MRIQHNISALKTFNEYNKNTSSVTGSMEKLSSGYRINKAADDASGLAVSEKMRERIRGLERGTLNIEDGISYVKVADGALHEVERMLERCKELSVQSMNGVYGSTERQALDNEVQALKAEMDRIFESTAFSDLKIWGDPKIEEIRQVIDTIYEPAVTFKSIPSIKIDEDNKDCISVNGYDVEADPQKGITLSWQGWDGGDYTAGPVPWPNPETAPLSFDIGDYLNSPLIKGDPTANPATKGELSFIVSYTVNSHSTFGDVIKALNGAKFGDGESPPVNIQLYDAAASDMSGKIASSISGLTVSSPSIDYDAQLFSGRDMELIGSYMDDIFIEPYLKGTTNISHPNYNSNTGGYGQFPLKCLIWVR